MLLDNENLTDNVADVELQDCERQPCEVWSRVMGYFRPFSEYNHGKKAEFCSRKCFSEEKAVAKIGEFDEQTAA